MNQKQYENREKAIKEAYWNNSEPDEFDSLHDILNETDLNIPEDRFNDAIKIVFMKLPEHILGSVVSWGISDTAVRDEIYEFVLKNHQKLFKQLIP